MSSSVTVLLSVTTSPILFGSLAGTPADPAGHISVSLPPRPCVPSIWVIGLQGASSTSHWPPSRRPRVACDGTIAIVSSSLHAGGALAAINSICSSPSCALAAEGANSSSIAADTGRGKVSTSICSGTL